MQSKTSFFNAEILRKNLVRFAPLWVLYSIACVLVLISDNEIGYWLASDMSDSLMGMPVLNCFYAFLCAQVLFGDLYNSRMCNSLHALPMRREGWFCAHVLSGLLFSLLPHLLVSFLSLLFLAECWAVAPIWLLVMTLQFLFFFGAAVLSAYCVGNRFAMLLVYGLLNGLSILVYVLLYCLYMPTLHGLLLDEAPFLSLCPLVMLCSLGQFIEVERIDPAANNIIDGIIREDYNSYLGEVHWGDTGSWIYLAICAAVGIGYMALGLLAYRKRHLESAGDFLAIRWLRPVFLILYCLCGGMAVYLFFSLFWGEEILVFLAIGLVIGWFTGKMLLERTIRVFGKKSLLGCGALVLAVFLSLGITRLDPFGLVTWMPGKEQIKAVSVSTYNQGDCWQTDGEALEIVQQLHAYGIQNPDADKNGEADVEITLEYQLNSGRLVRRQYSVDVATTAGAALEKLLSRKEYVFATEDITALRAKLTTVTLWSNNYEVPNELVTDWDGLLAAMERDCAEGNMAQGWSFHRNEGSVATLEFMSQTEASYHQYHNIIVYGSCTHTVAWLRENGYLTNETP